MAPVRRSGASVARRFPEKGRVFCRVLLLKTSQNQPKIVMMNGFRQSRSPGPKPGPAARKKVWPKWGSQVMVTRRVTFRDPSWLGNRLAAPRRCVGLEPGCGPLRRRHSGAVD